MDRLSRTPGGRWPAHNQTISERGKSAGWRWAQTFSKTHAVHQPSALDQNLASGAEEVWVVKDTAQY